MASFHSCSLHSSLNISLMLFLFSIFPGFSYTAGLVCGQSLRHPRQQIVLSLTPTNAGGHAEIASFWPSEIRS